MHRPQPANLPFRISVLVFLRNPAGELLLIERTKAPNLGCWSPIGGKLEMSTGESPHECAVRETAEETGLQVPQQEFHCFGTVSEKAYEGEKHWLMFLFDCKQTITALPSTIDEGRFGFFSPQALVKITLPPTDSLLVWPLWEKHRTGFVQLRADCSVSPPVIVEEQVIKGPSD
jgi:8-oxo-dGTP diphosphatase